MPVRRYGGPTATPATAISQDSKVGHGSNGLSHKDVSNTSNTVKVSEDKVNVINDNLQCDKHNGNMSVHAECN